MIILCLILCNKLIIGSFSNNQLIMVNKPGSSLEREGRGLSLRVGADPPQEPDAAQG